MLNLILVLLIIGRIVYIKKQKKNENPTSFFDESNLFYGIWLFALFCISIDSFFFSVLYFDEPRQSEAEITITNLESQMDDLKRSFVSEILNSPKLSEEYLSNNLEELLEDYIPLQLDIYDIESDLEHSLDTSDIKFDVLKFLVYFDL